jgi:hypothetical protein
MRQDEIARVPHETSDPYSAGSRFEFLAAHHLTSDERRPPEPGGQRNSPVSGCGPGWPRWADRRDGPPRAPARKLNPARVPAPSKAPMTWDRGCCPACTLGAAAGRAGAGAGGCPLCVACRAGSYVRWSR